MRIVFLLSHGHRLCRFARRRNKGNSLTLTRRSLSAISAISAGLLIPHAESFFPQKWLSVYTQKRGWKKAFSKKILTQSLHYTHNTAYLFVYMIVSTQQSIHKVYTKPTQSIHRFVSILTGFRHFSNLMPSKSIRKPRKSIRKPCKLIRKPYGWIRLRLRIGLFSQKT